MFQRIKRISAEREEKGLPLYKLSIGQPSGTAFQSAMNVAAEMVQSSRECFHEYQDNGCVGIPDFAERFVQAQVRNRNLKECNISYIPTPGTKPMLAVVILASNLVEGTSIGMTIDPGYPTPGSQAGYLRASYYALPTSRKNAFLFQPTDINGGTKLLMLNYPHNPSGKVAPKRWWAKLCEHCQENDIGLFNDNPYQLLSYGSSKSSTLTEVAVNYPDLYWGEAFTASKVIGNGTGWRVGAMAGSPEFIGDVATIKSNWDSGFAAPMAAGALYALENDQKSIDHLRRTYRKKMGILIDILSRHDMRLAIKPGAGFFSLWMVPSEAFGQKVANAEEFNSLMINRTGIVGVPFDHYIRYSVTGDIEEMKGAIEIAFAEANVRY